MATHLALVFGIGLVAIISPGPDFFLILRNALCYPRKAALATVCGTTTGFLCHVSLAAFGLAFVLQEYPGAESLIRYGGALYLFVLGCQSP